MVALRELGGYSWISMIVAGGTRAPVPTCEIRGYVTSNGLVVAEVIRNGTTNIFYLEGRKYSPEIPRGVGSQR